MALATLNLKISEYVLDGAYSAEHELWAQVLLQGIKDAALEMLNGNVDAEAVRWINSKADRVCSFIWMCDLFNLPSEVILEKVAHEVDEFSKYRHVSGSRKVDRD